MTTCEGGYGAAVRGRRAFANEHHQFGWMRAGGAREVNALLPHEAWEAGGRAYRELAGQSGRLHAASAKGAARIREITAEINPVDVPS